MRSRKFLHVIVAAALLVSAPSIASASISREDFKKFLETRDAMQDQRLQQMPDGQRLTAIAQKNFKMQPGVLQAILQRVEAEGGEKGVAEKSQAAVDQALAATPVKARVKEIRVDTGSPHVVTYIKWVAEEGKIEEEAALIALKAGAADKVTSTFMLWAIDDGGKSIWQAKIGADRTDRIKEERIPDWATTRYLRLFEVETVSAHTP